MLSSRGEESDDDPSVYMMIKKEAAHYGDGGKTDNPAIMWTK